MKVFVKKASIGVLMRWLQRALFAGAILMLGYCGWVLGSAWMFQRREAASFESPRTRLPSPAASPRPAVSPSALIGRIDIQRLGVVVVVVEGTGDQSLRRAAGHITGTALPGQPGNIGIAAHRDTFFRPLRNIHRGDIITLTTLRGQYRYRVMSTKVVDPRNVAVLDSDGTEILTLVTCYPFYFIGSAPNRFIVRAARVL